ncbi:MAG: response regulator, partial [Polyangiaceae bacterium]
MSRKKRVLVADDRAASRAAVTRMLKNHFDVVEEGDGAGAIARVKSGLALHAVLLDVEMPNVNGMEAFHRISIIAPALAKR